MNSLANDYFHMGDWTKALKFQREAVKIFEKLENCPLAETYNNLGNVYFQLAQYHKARYYLGKSVRTLKATQRNNDSQMGNAANNLGNVYYALGQFRKALLYHLNGLEIRVRTLPPNHPDLANSYSNIENDCYAIGDLKLLSCTTRQHAQSLLRRARLRVGEGELH